MAAQKTFAWYLFGIHTLQAIPDAIICTLPFYVTIAVNLLEE
jgi:hypothetical protein